MEICFYNMNHIGDVYFSSLFIRLICKLNPTIIFFYFSIHGDAFFKGIENIQRICPVEPSYSGQLINGGAPEDLLNSVMLRLLQSHHMEHAGAKIIPVNQKDFLFVNLWCASSYLQHQDFNIRSACIAYENLVNRLNNEFETNIMFDPAHIFEILENTPCVDYSKDLSRTFFVFNFKPRSVSIDNQILMQFIIYISKIQPVIVSSYDIELANYNNIKFADRDYGILPDPSCKNLMDLWDIATQCENIILLPTGACWTFLHKLGDLTPNKLIMFQNMEYCNRLNDIINFFLQEDKNLIQNYTVHLGI